MRTTPLNPPLERGEVRQPPFLDAVLSGSGPFWKRSFLETVLFGYGLFWKRYFLDTVLFGYGTFGEGTFWKG